MSKCQAWLAHHAVNVRHFCRGHYTKFLLPYERQMQILASAEESVRKDEGAVSDVAPTSTPEELEPAADSEDFIMEEEDVVMEEAEVSEAVVAAACAPGSNLTDEVIDLVEDSEGDDLAAL